jgi:hypothetical protein
MNSEALPSARRAQSRVRRYAGLWVRAETCMVTPPLGRFTTMPTGSGMFGGVGVLSRRWASREMMSVNSIWASAKPMQFRGPRPNGTQAASETACCCGVRPSNRSGSKARASGHAEGSRPARCADHRISVPLVISYPPTARFVAASLGLIAPAGWRRGVSRMTRLAKTSPASVSVSATAALAPSRGRETVSASPRSRSQTPGVSALRHTDQGVAPRNSG